MKSILALLLFCFFMQSSFGQTTKEVEVNAQSDFGKISLSVILPEKLEGLDAAQFSKLQSKIIQIITSNGLSASGYAKNFVIYPKFAIYDSNVVEGGMENIIVINCELSLYIKEVNTNTLYASVSKEVKGSGKNKSIALNNALQQIDVKENTWKTFIEAGKTKIVQYYESKCNDIIAKADTLLKAEEYEQSISVLLSIPEELSNCYKTSQLKALEVFKLYKEKQALKLLANAKMEFEKGNYTEGLNLLQKIDPSSAKYADSLNLIKDNRENICKQLILKTKAAIATKDFIGAATNLKLIPPDSTCLNEAQELMKDLETKFTAEDKRNWDLKLQQIQDQVALKRDEITAMKEIAIATAQSQPKSVTYNNVIK